MLWQERDAGRLNEIVELFGEQAVPSKAAKWKKLVQSQGCPFLEKKCIKTRKSEPAISIGTCTVEYGADSAPIVICPKRFIERRQIFIDSIHLLTAHEPGNELYVIPEVHIPGGSVDYFLASVSDGKVRDFVGIEIQTLDTTGSVWPARQRFLAKCGIPVSKKDLALDMTYGMNWKMTAKTILVQLHHKIESFEHVNKHLVLAIQDQLLHYMRREFSFDHLGKPKLSDPMHFHAYALGKSADGYRIKLADRFSTDRAGIATCLGRVEHSRVELSEICKILESKLPKATLLRL